MKIPDKCINFTPYRYWFYPTSIQLPFYRFNNRGNYFTKMNADIAKKITGLSRIFLEWLKDNGSFRTAPVRCTIDGISPGVYFINIVRVNPSLFYIQEIVSSKIRGQVVFRSWSFEKKKTWKVIETEKFRTPIAYHNLKDELSDLSARVEIILAVSVSRGAYFAEALEDADKIMNVTIPEDVEIKRNGPFSRLNLIFYRYFAVILAGILALGVFSLVTVYTAHIYSFRKKVETSMEDYSKNMDSQAQEFFQNTEGQISTLVNKLKQTQESFDFDRKNAYVNVLRMAEELTKYFPARKKAYRLIANNILEAANYSEVLYELSRLPTEEYQARIFLATDRESVTPLAEWEPVFSFMVYPVKIESEKNDGRGFRITDGYMSIRENPLGSGGSSPHYAVDIINVSNIAYVDNAGVIIREGNPPGNIVAAYSGMVRDSGWDSRYGNFIMINHELTKEVLSKYPKATGWSTYYAHMKDLSPIKQGERVNANETIGFIGNTGHSTGPHLHFEVRIYKPNGIYSDVNGRFIKINPFPSTHSKKAK